VSLQQIVAELTAERDQLDKAIAALNGISTQPRRGRPPKKMQTTTTSRRRRRHLSAEGRRRISEAAKRRWAKHRKKAR
jgi:hypothetical protein